MKKILLLVFISASFLRAALLDSGAVLIVEPLGRDPLTSYSQNHSRGLVGRADLILKDPDEMAIPSFGVGASGKIKVTMIGDVDKQGHYGMNDGVSLDEAIALAGGFSRVAASHFLIRRADKLIRLNIGSAREIAPFSKDIMKVIVLRNNDVVWVSLGYD